MKEFYKFTEEQLKDYILSSKDIELILSDNEFKDYLLELENHYVFVWLVEHLDELHKKKLLTNDYLEKIITDDLKAASKYDAILKLYSNIFIGTSKKVMIYVLTNFIEYFKIIDEKTAEYFIHSIIYKLPDKLELLQYFSYETQNRILDLTNIEAISNIPGFEKIIIKLSPKIIVRLINYGIFSNVIDKLNKDDLAYLSKKIKEEDLFSLINNLDFIIFVSSLENPNYYRYIVNNLLVNNYPLVQKIERYRFLYTKCQFELENNEGIFENYICLSEKLENGKLSKEDFDKIPEEIEYYYYDGKISKSILKSITIKRKLQLLCDLYFKDYSENVLYNLNEIIIFSNDNVIIPEDNLELYKKFINFNILSDEEINKLLINSVKKDYAKILYNDILKCKHFSYELYNKEFFKPDKNSALYNKDISKKYGLDVYNFSGEKFLACVHCGCFHEGINKKTISLSIIGSENIGVFDKSRIIVGYTHLEPDKIMHVYNRDSYTSGEDGTTRVNKIYKPHDLLKETYFYNEILYSEKKCQLIPEYVVCIDGIDDLSYDYAKSNNLPIVIIDSSKYKIALNYVDDKEYRNTYMTREEDYYEQTK